MSKETLPPMQGEVLELGYIEFRDLDKHDKGQVARWVELHGHSVNDVISMRISLNTGQVRFLLWDRELRGTVENIWDATCEDEVPLQQSPPVARSWIRHRPNPGPGELFTEPKPATAKVFRDGKLIEVIEDDS